MIRMLLCDSCRHRRRGIPMTCDASPEGVPARFRFGAEMHVKPAEGDHGLRFELADDLPEDCRRLALRMVESWKRRPQQPPAREPV